MKKLSHRIVFLIANRASLTSCQSDLDLEKTPAIYLFHPRNFIIIMAVNTFSCFYKIMMESIYFVDCNLTE